MEREAVSGSVPGDTWCRYATEHNVYGLRSRVNET